MISQRSGKCSLIPSRLYRGAIEWLQNADCYHLASKKRWCKWTRYFDSIGPANNPENSESLQLVSFEGYNQVIEVDVIISYAFGHGSNLQSRGTRSQPPVRSSERRTRAAQRMTKSVFKGQGTVRCGTPSKKEENDEGGVRKRRA